MYHIPCGIVGGAETHVMSLVNALPEGVETLVTYEYPQIEPFLHKNFKTKNFYRAFSPLLFSKKVSEWKPDIIQFYHCPVIYSYLGKVNIGGAKVVEVAHNRTSFPTDCSTYAKDRTDVLVCVSQSAKEHYISKRGEDVPLIVIPNGIDTTVFTPKPHKPLPATLTGGYCGRFEAGNGKGISMILDIVSKLPVNFELVGYDFGNHKARIQKLDNVKYFNHTSDIASYYHKWDFFLSCSPAEGFGLSIAEALACNLPSVILDCGGICRHLEHGRHAYIAKDAEDVVKGLETIIRGETYHPLEVDFSATKMASNYLELYQALAGDTRCYTIAEHKKAPPPPEVLPKDYTLGITPENWQGIRQALASKCDKIIEPQHVLRDLNRLGNPTEIIFGGFMLQWVEILRSLRKNTNAFITIAYHGTALIGDYDPISRDGLVATIMALKEDLADCISTPHEGMARMFNLLYKVRAVYEPNKVTPIERPAVEKLPGMNVGIFGTGLPWKNVNTQILGAAMTPGLGMTHLQNLHHPELMKQLKIPYKVHPYYHNRADFFRLAAQMTLNLAVTTTEAFGYLPVESFMLGVPAIVSSTTPSFRGASGNLKRCIVSYIDDPAAVSEAIMDVMDHYEEVLEEGARFVRTLM